MGILLTIIIGFVAGIIAKFLYPGPTNRKALSHNHPRHRGCICSDVHRPGLGLVSGP